MGDNKTAYSAVVCNERHQAINKQLETHDRRLDNNEERLDTLEQHKVSVDVKIENLIQKIDDLIGTLKWFLLGLLGSGGSFIVWQIKEVLTN